MSNIYHPFTNQIQRHRTCRVAYTLGNTQNVTCTIISDQPLFYMGHEITFEDEDENSGGFSTLENEIALLKSEIELLEKHTNGRRETGAKRTQEFYENTHSIFEAPDLDLKDTGFIEEIVYTLNQSRTAEAYLKLALNNKVKIKPCAQIEDAFYDQRTRHILINPNMEIMDQLLLVVRELRRHWQHMQGALINPLLFQPEHAILVNRAQNADLSHNMIRIAWELQLTGYRGMWLRIENSSLHDLTQTYAQEAYRDFRTISNGVAGAAAFEEWFLSERCRQHDKKIIQTMLADYKGYVFGDTSNARPVIAEMLSALGNMPFGKNYLSLHVPTIMNDPIFTEVRDRSNANFLWFIKFERSFKDAEKEISKEDLSTGDKAREIIYSAYPSRDQAYDQSHTAQIIHLYGNPSENSGGSRIRKTSKNKTLGQKSAEIIDFLH